MRSVKAARLSLGFLLLAAAPLSARGGWFTRRDDCAPDTRHARAEYEAEHSRARRLQYLDCAGLAGDAETSRMISNQRYLANYQRLRVSSAPAPAPAPLPVITPPTIPPPPGPETPPTPSEPRKPK
jgi:hypothetical protein